MYRVYKKDSAQFYQEHQSELKGKAALVYLDPPYNSKRKRGARKYYHDSNALWSVWLSSILKDSREMLSENGFLAVSINQTELFNLKNLADEILGAESFIGLFPVKIRHKERQLMINATFHDVYEYMLIYRRCKRQRFVCENKPINIEQFSYQIQIKHPFPEKKILHGKNVEIYESNQYEIVKSKGSPEHFRRYIIAGKLKTANWSGEWFENHLRQLGTDKLIKVYGLENEGLGYRWFQTQNNSRRSGVYFQSARNAGRPILPTNDLDYTNEVTGIYQEGGDGCDFKDSKKPEKLLEWLIGITTHENDLVVDLFGGSGTTLAVCMKHQRNCMIVDKNNEPYEMMKKRVTHLKNQFPHLENIQVCFL